MKCFDDFVKARYGEGANDLPTSDRDTRKKPEEFRDYTGTMPRRVREFNLYDLSSGAKEPQNVQELRPSYEDFIAKYFRAS